MVIIYRLKNLDLTILWPMCDRYKFRLHYYFVDFQSLTDFPITFIVFSLVFLFVCLFFFSQNTKRYSKKKKKKKRLQKYTIKNISNLSSIFQKKKVLLRNCLYSVCKNFQVFRILKLFEVTMHCGLKKRKFGDEQ